MLSSRGGSPRDPLKAGSRQACRLDEPETLPTIGREYVPPRTRSVLSGAAWGVQGGWSPPAVASRPTPGVVVTVGKGPDGLRRNDRGRKARHLGEQREVYSPTTEASKPYCRLVQRRASLPGRPQCL